MTKEKKRKIFQILISAFLLFHVLGVILTPNPSSFAFQTLSSLYKPYMSVLGLGSTWGFFAPEPVSPPLYIDYVLEQKGALPVTGRFPAEKDPYFFRDRYNRALSMTKFIASSEDNLKNMFMNYLCHLHPKMESAKLWRVLGSEPSLEEVQKGKRIMTDPVDYHIDVIGTFYCPEKTL